MAELIKQSSSDVKQLAAKVISEFTQEERDVYEKLLTMIKKEAVDEILGRYRIAHFVHTIYNNYRHKHKRDNFIQRLATALEYTSANPLYEMIKVVDKWPDEKELHEQILSQINKDITWKELVYIARLDNKYEENIAIEAFNSQKSVDEARLIIGKKAERQGRNVKTEFSGPVVFAREVFKRVADLNKRIEDAFLPFLDKGDLTVEVLNLTDKQQSLFLSFMSMARDELYELAELSAALVRAIDDFMKKCFPNAEQTTIVENSFTSNDEE